MGELVDLTGQKFGRLTVIRIATEEERNNRAEVYWLCKCDCGNEKIISGHSIKRGLVVSCGCYHKEISQKRRKHGESKTKFYKLWHGIIERCENPTNGSYKNYGAKGIKILGSVDPELDHQSISYDGIEIINTYDEEEVVNFVFNKNIWLKTSCD